MNVAAKAGIALAGIGGAAATGIALATRGSEAEPAAGAKEQAGPASNPRAEVQKRSVRALDHDGWPGSHPTDPGNGPGDSGGPSGWMSVDGTVDPPGLWDSYSIFGELSNGRLDATMDMGWGSDARLSGRVDGGSFRTSVDTPGWGNDVDVTGYRTSNGYRGTVDLPGSWSSMDHVITETSRGARAIRNGRFEDPFSFSDARWSSSPDGYGGGRTLTFDPPGWNGTTHVTLNSNVPAGVEATIAAALYNDWKQDNEYPGYDPYDPYVPYDPYDPGYPDSGYPGDGGNGPGDGGGWDDYPIV